MKLASESAIRLGLIGSLPYLDADTQQSFFDLEFLCFFRGSVSAPGIGTGTAARSLPARRPRNMVDSSSLMLEFSALVDAEYR
ncbi:hypothetical protein ST47_g8333 [Ascochyta rabiei]|uniref:Uncharacterized protein n=1 Tax=Didymella rabiei TaxID=5454 RepID=A0A162ZCK7_DIDRA|nr:hypothetical protein ST47_g8333 [Ascochyta rabiei]